MKSAACPKHQFVNWLVGSSGWISGKVIRLKVRMGSGLALAVLFSLYFDVYGLSKQTAELGTA